jgi:hypothetical protein
MEHCIDRVVRGGTIDGGSAQPTAASSLPAGRNFYVGFRVFAVERPEPISGESPLRH